MRWRRFPADGSPGPVSRSAAIRNDKLLYQLFSRGRTNVRVRNLAAGHRNEEPRPTWLYSRMTRGICAVHPPGLEPGTH